MCVCIYDHPVQFNPCCKIHPVSTNKAEPKHDMEITFTNVTYMTRRNVRCKQSYYRMYGPVFVLYGEFLGLNRDFAVIFSGGLAGDLEGGWLMIYSCWFVNVIGVLGYLNGRDVDIQKVECR